MNLDPKSFPLIQTLAELRVGEYGRNTNIVAHRGFDDSRVLVFFNGMIDADKLHLSPIFNRYTWAKKFRHSSIFVHDSEVGPHTGLRIGWYIGTKNRSSFLHRLGTLDDFIGTEFESADKVCIVSSAGGFPSLVATLNNWSKHAVVFNPQTDVRRYRQGFYKKFRAHYLGSEDKKLGPSDEVRISALPSVQNYQPKGCIHYYQNISDELHFKEHFTPFMESIRLEDKYRMEAIRPYLYNNPERGHSPPDRDRTLWAIGHALPGALDNSVI